MFRFRELVDRHRADLAAAITAEHGKVLSDAAGEVARALEVVEFACGLADHLKGSYSEQVSTGIDVYSIRQPLGVVAGITPFNFPVMVPLWMVSNAIACGNAFILKPSEKDPSPSLLHRRAARRGRRPRRRLQRRARRPRARSNAILEHPGIAAVSFVGSTPIAKHVYETGTRNGKRVQALGGAKNHMVVLPDADVDAAADAAVSAAYGSAGERCMAISVVVAVGDVGRSAGRRDRGAPARSCASGPAPIPTARWDRSSPASTATRSRATSTAGTTTARRSSSTGASARSKATASSSACR